MNIIAGLSVVGFRDVLGNGHMTVVVVEADQLEMLNTTPFLTDDDHADGLLTAGDLVAQKITLETPVKPLKTFMKNFLNSLPGYVFYAKIDNQKAESSNEKYANRQLPRTANNIFHKIQKKVNPSKMKVFTRFSPGHIRSGYENRKRLGFMLEEFDIEFKWDPTNDNPLINAAFLNSCFHRRIEYEGIKKKSGSIDPYIDAVLQKELTHQS